MYRFLREKARALADAATALSPLQREAGDPATSPERLREIIGNYRWTVASTVPQGVLAAVASNPNAPPEVLRRLAREFTAEFVANPAVPLAVLESPDFVTGFTADALLRLCARMDTPPVFLAATAAQAKHHHAATAARVNIVLAGEAAPGTGLEETRNALAKFTPGDGCLLQELHELRTIPSWTADIVEGAIARLPAETEGDYRARQRSRSKVRRPLALYGAAAEQRWRERHAPFTQWPDNEGLRMGAAQDLRTPPELLVQLAEYGSYAVRLNIARNPAAPAEALRHLAPPEHCRGTLLPRALAVHPETPEDVLRILAKSLSGRIHARVAAHSSCPEDVLILLARSDSCPVRRAARQTLESRNVGFTKASTLWETAQKKAMQQSLNQLPGTLTRFLAVHGSKQNLRKENGIESLLWEDRLAAALWPELAVEELKKLSGDAARPVRAIACDRLKDQNRNALFMRDE